MTLSELQSAAPASTDPALPENIINLPAVTTSRSLARTDDQALADELIGRLSTNYVRKENRFYHIDRPSEALSQNDLQRSFLTPAQAINQGRPVPKHIMKVVYDTAIVQMNPDPFRSIPVWTGAIVPYPGNPERRIQLESGQVVLNSWKEPA